MSREITDLTLLFSSLMLEFAHRKAFVFINKQHISIYIFCLKKAGVILFSAFKIKPTPTEQKRKKVTLEPSFMSRRREFIAISNRLVNENLISKLTTYKADSLK